MFSSIAPTRIYPLHAYIRSYPDDGRMRDLRVICKDVYSSMDSRGFLGDFMKIFWGIGDIQLDCICTQLL